MQVFVIVNNVGIKINADVNAKNVTHKGIQNKGFIWIPSNWECECDKLCDVREYLDYEVGQCKKRLIDKLVEECSEIIDEVKIAKILFMDSTDDEHKCTSSCTIYVILIVIFFTICIEISTYFIYYKYLNHDKKTASKYDYIYQLSHY